MGGKIVFSTCPNSEGEMLWCVHYASAYHDGEEAIPIDNRFFVLAKTESEAIKKSGVKKRRKRSGYEERIMASIMTLENLIPARDSSNDGRMGWHSNTKHAPVSLTHKEDSCRYRLAVCLVPIKN
jgi:hypothetical protein